MKSHRALALCAVFFVAVGAVGCSGGPSEEEVAAAAAKELGNVIQTDYAALQQQRSDLASAQAEIGELERYLVDSVIDDLERHRPKLIGVDRLPFKQALGLTTFDFVHYFGRYPRFKKLFSKYRRAGEAVHLTLYVRD